MMHRVLLTFMVFAVCVTVFLNDCSSECVAAESSASATLGLPDFTQLPLLAQAGNDDSGSGTRVRGRSIRGLISLGILLIGGIGWVFKKMFGGDE